jgi:VCBS repeat-containing protein
VNGLYTNWNTGEPNGSASENNLHINGGGTWNDLNTANALASVVEWTGTAYRAAAGVAASVMENAAANTVVGTMAATDPDSGETYTYTLVGGATSKFQISGTQLQVKSGATFDFESTPVETVTVRVTDSGGNTRDLTTTINVVNVNEAPGDTGVVGSTNLVTNGSFETGGVGDGQVSGWTLSGGGGTFGNSGRASSGSQFFAFNSNTTSNNGVLSQAITTVVGQAYQLSFDFQSAGSGTIQEGLQVQVLDGTTSLRNESMYDTTSSGSMSSAAYNTYTYTFVASSTSTTIRFSDIAASASNSNDGDLDNVMVRAITTTNPTMSIAENSANSSAVGTINTYDADNNSGLTYSLTNNAGGAYAINSTTGVVTVANSSLLNFETTPTSTIVVRTTDQGGLTFDKTVTVNLTNVNETPTAVFDTATAVEAGGVSNGTAGTNPTGNVLTNDTDIDASDTKTVSGVAAGTVGSASTNVGSAVTGTFGSINIAANGAYTYTVDNTNATVQALRTSGQTLTDVFTYTMRDAVGLTSTTQITVTIQGSNDAPVAVVDTATAIEAGGVANATAGTNPTGNVLTNDTDVDSAGNGETKTVSGVLAGVQASAAANVGSAVTGTYGSINIAANGAYTYTVDNSNAAVQALRLTANTLNDVFTYTTTDTAGSTSTTQITVTVQGANDAPSDITGTLTIAENSANTTSVGTLSRVDVDSGDGSTYALTNDASGRFAINSSTGQVTVANSSLINYEANASHTIVAQVTDTAGATFSKTMTVTVTDINEAANDITLGSAPTGLTTAGNASLVSGSTYQLTAATTNQAGAVWGAVNLTQDFTITSKAYLGASDAAADGIVFALQNQSSTAVGNLGIGLGAQGISSAFGIALDTYTNSGEVNSDFSQFFKGGEGYQAGSTTFDTPNLHDNLEDAQWHDFVIIWNATSKTLSYSLDGVSIDSKTYDVVATDWGGNANGFFGFAGGTGGAGNQQQIEITSVQVGSVTSIAENSSSGTVVGLVTAVDPDRTGTVTYSLTDTAGGRFAINSSTGQITVASGAVLDFETNSSHKVVVQATDQGSLSYSETMTINVSNVNEAPVDISTATQSITIINSSFESQTLGDSSFTVTAPTGWTLTGNGGTHNPATSNFISGNGTAGSNVGYTNAGSLSQTRGRTRRSRRRSQTAGRRTDRCAG